MLMKIVGKYLDNDELEKILVKLEGLGIEVMCVGIIIMFKDCKYIDVKKN